MNDNIINQLIILLTVIKEFSKDIHYSCHGESFYGKHLLVDHFDFNDSIDLVKECILLGHGIRPLASKEYLLRASNILVPPEEHNDKKNFEILQDYLQEALHLIQSLTELSKADENVIGGIAQYLQQYYGLLNLQVEE